MAEEKRGHLDKEAVLLLNRGRRGLRHLVFGRTAVIIALLAAQGLQALVVLRQVYVAALAGVHDLLLGHAAGGPLLAGRRLLTVSRRLAARWFLAGRGGTLSPGSGLLAGSRALDRSFLDRHAADLWLPGAPTHPMLFIDGIRTLLGHKTRT